MRFLDELLVGRLRWDLLHPFPVQDPTDRAAGDAAVAGILRLLRDCVDPDAVDRTGTLPDDLVRRLHDQGHLDLTGRTGLSSVNAFQVITAAASWSTPVGFLLAIHNGLGAGAHLQNLPPGPLRDLVTDRLTAGALFGMADTEPGGAANDGRSTTAVAVTDGDGSDGPHVAGYRIDGEKVFIGNGPLADLVVTTAEVDGDVGLFVVDRSAFTVRASHQYLGLRGLPSAALRFERARVPAERRIPTPGRSWRDNAAVAATVARGRFLIMAAPSLAIARHCTEWSRRFVAQRRSNGRPLGSYAAIRRIAALNLADVAVIESVAQWVLLGGDRTDVSAEQVAAKNLTSLAAWRASDRTLSLFGAEGYETADSKARRGAPALPIERLLRDARGLRVAGGVDFLVDLLAGQALLYRRWERGATPAPTPAPNPSANDLSARNREHLHHLVEQADRLGVTCDRLLRRHRDPQELVERQHPVILLHRIAAEVFAMAVVLARAAHPADRVDGLPDALTGELADVYCTEARHRLADSWHRLDDDGPAATRVGAAWLAGVDAPHPAADPLGGRWPAGP